MAAVLQEKQFELDGRVVFGLGAPVEIPEDGWTPGDADITNQDVKLPTRDGIRFGKDTRGSATWGFKFFTNAETEEEAWASLAPLAGVWKDPAIRGSSGRVVGLRYRVADQTRVIFGRPRRWTATPNNLSLSGRIDVVADFATVDDVIYGDDLHSFSIGLAPPLDEDVGLIVPTIVPFTSDSHSAGVRDFTIVVEGERSTPATVVFTGPLTDASLVLDDWTVQLLDPVVAGDPVTVDGRPWVSAATKKSGGGVRVSPRVTRIAKMWLDPGTHSVRLSGTGPVGTAGVTVTWRDAFNSPR